MKETALINPPFGDRSRAEGHGFTLDLMIGWIEEMISCEGEACEAPHTSKHRVARLEAAEDALQLLQEVSEWTPLLTKFYDKKRDTDRKARAAIALAEDGGAS